MENNITEVNEGKLQQSLKEVFKIFEENTNKYKDVNKEFTELSKNSIKNLNKVFSLVVKGGEEENIQKSLDKLYKTIENFYTFSEKNDNDDITNNFFIINHFYNIAVDFNEKISTEPFEDFFSFLQNNSEKTSIFDPLELEIENDNKEDEIHFIYTNKNTIEYSSINFKEEELQKIWKQFTKNAYEESKKILKNLENDTKIKTIPVKKSNFKKLIETFSKKPRSLSCWIL